MKLTAENIENSLWYNIVDYSLYCIVKTGARYSVYSINKPGQCYANHENLTAMRTYFEQDIFSFMGYLNELDIEGFILEKLAHGK